MVYEPQRQEAEWNDAMGYTERIKNWFYGSGESAMQLNAYYWYHFLTVIYRELSTWMKPKEQEEIEILVSELWDMTNTWSRIKNKTGNTSMNKDMWMKLHTLELKLRRVYAESGVMMKKSQGPLSALK